MFRRRGLMLAPLAGVAPVSGAVTQPSSALVNQGTLDLRGHVSEAAADFIFASDLRHNRPDLNGFVSTYIENQHAAPLNFTWKWKGGRLFRTAISPLLRRERESRIFLAYRPEIDDAATIQYTPLRRIQRAPAFVDAFGVDPPTQPQFPLFFEQRSPVQLPNGERDLLRISVRIELSPNSVLYRIDRQGAGLFSVGFTNIGHWSADALGSAVSQLMEQRVEVVRTVLERQVPRALLDEFFEPESANRPALFMRGGGQIIEGTLTRVNFRLPRPSSAPLIQSGDVVVLDAVGALIAGGSFPTFGFERL